MKWLAVLVGALSTVLPVAWAAAADSSAIGSEAVVQLRLADDNGQEVDATGVLVHREDRPGGVVLYFLTHAGAVPRQLRLPSESAGGSNHGAAIAVLRISVARSEVTPAPIVLEPPTEGMLAFVVSYKPEGRVVTTQRLRKISMSVAIGDREIAWPGCAGSPAFTELGVFGIVTECAPGQPPAIALLSGARSLLRRLVPHLDLGPDGSQTFGIGM
jgi:hypothetical protein